MSSFQSYTSSGSLSPRRSSPVQISSRATPTEPLSISLSHRRDSQVTSPAFEFGSATRKRSIERPTAYVSDEDLWGLDSAPYLREAPAPPRTAEQWLARPIAGAYERRSSGLAQAARTASNTNQK